MDEQKVVLIVDDHPDGREAFAEHIRARLGLRVLEAATGAEAVAIAVRDQPCVVILDIGLPDIDGFEVARRLKALDPANPARIIFITGYSRETDRARAFECGCNVFLVKPCDLDELVDWVRSFL